MIEGQSVLEVATLNLEIQQELVLATLVEEFGGEVTVTALTRYLSHQLSWTQPALRPRLFDVLQALQQLGGVSLEANGASDFIVRLSSDAAKLHV